MNNLLFASLAFVVLLGTVFPLIAEALRGSRLSVGEPYFDRMATPIGLALLFLMAAAPALPWRATSGEVVRNRLLVPAWIGGVTMLVAVVLGARGLAEVLAYGLGAFATAGIVRQFVLGIRGRRRALGESRAVALGRATRSNPRLYGGLVVHFGVVLIAVVLAASSAYGANRTVKLTRGESATVSGYTVTYLGSHTTRSDQKVTVAADVKVAKGDRVLGTYSPTISTYPNSSDGIGTPSVHTGLVDDLYLTLVSSPGAGRAITLGVRVNPLIVWLWIGGGVHGARHDPRAGAAVAPTPRASIACRRPRAGAVVTTRDESRRGDGVKHPARIVGTGRRARGRSCSVSCSRSTSGSDPQSDAAAEPARRARPRRTSTCRTSTGGRVSLADIAGKSDDRQLLELVVHPVPGRSARPGEVLRAAQGRSRLHDGRHRPRRRERQAMKAYVKKYGLEWTVALDPDSLAALDFGTRGQPETYAITPSGVVAAAYSSDR